jgi:drug/metabolite transporter (DMT)-like permease
MSNEIPAGLVRPISARPVLIVFLVVVDSVHFVFARLLLPHISPYVSVFYVMAIGMIQVGLCGWMYRRIHFRTLFRNRLFFLSIGFLIGVSTIINYEAVAFIDPGTAALLAKSSILMSLALAIVWLKDRLTKIQGYGVLLALCGVLLITFQPGDYIRFGSLLILISAFMYALHTAIVKNFSEEMDFVEFFFFRIMTTAALMFCVALGKGALIWPTKTAWGLIFLTATVDTVISRALFYLLLRRLKMSIHAIVLTLSPVAAILWTYIFFDIVPTGQQLTGGVAVILGVFMATFRQSI